MKTIARSRQTKIKWTIEEINSKLPVFVKIKEDTIYVNAHTKYTFVDTEYGSWSATLNNVVTKNSRHPKRGEVDRRKNKSIDIELAKTKLPSFVSLLEPTYVNITTKCTLLDIDYGEFVAVPWNVIHYQSGHPSRAFKKTALKLTNSVEIVKSRLPQFVTIVESTYVGGHIKAKFVDSEYGEFTAMPYSVMGQQSRHPNAHTKNSKPQLKLQSWVESLGFNVITSAKPFANSRHEIDIYIPELKFGIEYNGAYWHSGPKSELKMLNKQLRAEQDGIKLLQFWCYEWENENIKTKLKIQKELQKRASNV